MKPNVPREHSAVTCDWGSGGLIVRARQGARSLENGVLAKLRERARRELNIPMGVPVVASGHQPLPVHPGIALRELLLQRLPEEVFPLWIAVDSDAPRRVSMPIPLRRTAYTHHDLVLHDNARRKVLGELPVPCAIDALWPAIERRLRSLSNPEILARACAFWRALPPAQGDWACWVDEARRAWAGGLPRVKRVSVLAFAQTSAYKAFVRWALRDKDAFLEAYTVACQAADVGRLGPGELPFWTLRDGCRTRAAEHDVPLLPRALTLTWAVRALLCDFFVHGAGGAGYEPGVDVLWSRLCGQDPPPWGWIAGTFTLPEPDRDSRMLPGRSFPFFLHDPDEVVRALRGPLAAL